jgi:hypothetical protein
MGGGMVPLTGRYSEAYELAKTKLNPRAFGSLGGVWRPHSYLYCRRNYEIQTDPWLKLFSDEQSINAETLEINTPLNGEMIEYVIKSTAWGSWPHTIWSPAGPTDIMVGKRHYFADGSPPISLNNGVPANDLEIPGPHTGPVWEPSVWAFHPTVLQSGASYYVESPLYRFGVEEPRPRGLSVIRVAYHGDNDGGSPPGILAAALIDDSFVNAIKLIYTDPTPVQEDSMSIGGFLWDALTKATSIPGGDYYYSEVTITYLTDHEYTPLTAEEMIGGMSSFHYYDHSKEAQMLLMRFGSDLAVKLPTLKRVRREIYNSAMRGIAREIDILDKRSKRLFLRNGQPNRLRIQQLENLTDYIEFNTTILSMLETHSLLGPTVAASVYDPPEETI